MKKINIIGKSYKPSHLDVSGATICTDKYVKFQFPKFKLIFCSNPHIVDLSFGEKMGRLSILT